MADGILGLGSEGSSSLNEALIESIKEKEYEAKIVPIETDLEEIDEEQIAIDEIETKTLEMLETMSAFDLFTTGTNVFDEVTATTSGDSAIFDASDTSTLSEGMIYVEVTQLAQKDVYQSNALTDDIDSVLTTGQSDEDTLSITIDGETFEFTTQDKTYQELVDEINNNSGSKIEASIENVSDDEFRLVIKSTDPGLENAITISQTDDLDLGFDDADNKILEAQNLLATVDGVEYDISDNTITTYSGLSVTAVETGNSSISITQEKDYVSEYIDAFVTQYNEYIDLYATATLDSESPITNTSTIRMMMNEIKNILFDTYGDDEDQSIFNYGFSLDEYGYLSLDETEWAAAVSDNFDDLKELFVGTAEDEGIGTRLKTYLDALDGYEGLLTEYEDGITERQTTLEEDKETALETLDAKYEAMAAEFAAATVAITQMENEFASLLAIIEDS